MRERCSHTFFRSQRLEDQSTCASILLMDYTHVFSKISAEISREKGETGINIMHLMALIRMEPSRSINDSFSRHKQCGYLNWISNQFSFSNLGSAAVRDIERQQAV